MLALKSLVKRPQDLNDMWILMRLTGIHTPQALGRTIAHFTGSRIFEAQGQPWMPFHIDPTFHDIFDNAPDDLRPPGYGPTSNRNKAAQELSTPMCGIARCRTDSHGQVTEWLTGPCVRPQGHHGRHRYGPRQ